MWSPRVQKFCVPSLFTPDFRECELEFSLRRPGFFFASFYFCTQECEKSNLELHDSPSLSGAKTASGLICQSEKKELLLRTATTLTIFLSAGGKKEAFGEAQELRNLSKLEGRKRREKLCAETLLYREESRLMGRDGCGIDVLRLHTQRALTSSSSWC